jgi:hypothetical protein
MEACAENNIELIILDRPNLMEVLTDQPKIHQFVGMHHSLKWITGGTLLRYCRRNTPAENTRIQVILPWIGC